MSAVDDARTTARRIVQQVLAEQDGPVLAEQDENGRGAGDRPEVVIDVPDLLVDLADDHPLVAARRIVEEVLAEQEHVGAPPPDDPAAAARAMPAEDVASADDATPGEPAPLADRLFQPSTADATAELLFDRETVEERQPGDANHPPRDHAATVPEPIPDPGPFPGPDPLPDPDPFPPDPSPQPDPFPPDPQPQPAPDPQPAPEPLSQDAGPAPGPDAALVAPSEPTPARKEAVDTARRIVQEVVAAHEAAEQERELAAASQRAFDVEAGERRKQAAADEAQAALEAAAQARQERAAAAERQAARQSPPTARGELDSPPSQDPEGAQRHDVLGLDAGWTLAEEAPDLAELPPPRIVQGPQGGPPPLPAAAQAPEAASTPPTAEVSLEEDDEAPTAPLVAAGEPSAPRTGRWLMTTIIGAVSLALLFPLAVRALRSLVTLT